MKNVRYILEYMLLALITGIFTILPWRKASNLGNFIGRSIGPRLAASRKAERHAAQSLPDKSDDEIKDIVAGMWGNLGRLMAEYPHLKKIAREAVIYDDDSMAIIRELADDEKPGILVGAHIGNWEAIPYALLNEGLAMHSIYRRPNNPYVANLLEKYRTSGGLLKAFPKSKKGTIQMAKAMKNGEHVGMLIDQKYNEGIDSVFFGRPAPTSTLFIDLVRRFDCPIVFGYAVRGPNNTFIGKMFPPITTRDENGKEREDIDILDEYHRRIEEWIREYPDQWLWIHRRWRDS